MIDHTALAIILRDLFHEAREGLSLYSLPMPPGPLVLSEPRPPRNGEDELIARYAAKIVKMMSAVT